MAAVPEAEGGNRRAVNAQRLLVLAVRLLVTAFALLEQQFRRSGALRDADVRAA